MQAQKTAPPDMQLKDKFLIQGTIAPYGSGDEDIIPGLFSKENGRYIEENKLRVVLVSPPHSPILQPINGALKLEPTNEAPAPKETPISKVQVPLIDVQNFSPSHMKEAEDLKWNQMKEVEDLKSNQMKEFEDLKSNQMKEVEDLKLKISSLESNLNEADKTISTLREEKRFAIQERDKLQQEVIMLRRKCAARVQMGFPFLFVVFMALVGALLGYVLHQ